MLRVDGMEKAQFEYTQQNNATVKALETKVGQLPSQMHQRNLRELLSTLEKNNEMNP